MARLRRREDRDGKYELDYYDIDGRRYRVNTGTSEKKLAELWLRRVEELLTQARLGIIGKVGRIDAEVIASKEKRKQSLTLEQFKARYEERCRHDIELAESTISLNKLAIDSFIGIIGDKILADISDNDVVKWKKVYGSKNSKTTLSMYHRALRAAFNRAIKWGMAEANPFAAVEVAKADKNAKEKNMSYEEVRLLLKHIREADYRQFENYVQFLLYTGCRRNEILFLRWESLNLGQMSLSVRQDKIGGRKLVIPINKALKRVIDGMELKQAGYVFQTQSGSRGVKAASIK